MNHSTYQFESKPGARARVAQFIAQASQPEELHLCIEAPTSGSFAEQLAAVEAQHAMLRREFSLNDETTVLRRLFLSDGMNQSEQLGASRLAVQPGGSPVAFSVVEQPPLDGRRLGLWEYHLRGPSIPNKRRVPDGVAVRCSGLSHIWACGLRAPGTSAFEQTDGVLRQFGDLMAPLGATLRDHAVRTWLFVSDIDAEYAGLVAARKQHFERIGLTAETHYLSSTGIAGRGLSPKNRVVLDAYAIAGLSPNQVKFLTAPQYLGPTHLYGVTFERGTRIGYADRNHVYLSGTASIDPAGNTLHLGDIDRQCQRAFENTEALLADAGATRANVVQLIAYVRDAADGPAVSAFLDRQFGKTPRIVVRAAVCRPNWLVEFECIALLAQSQPEMAEF